MARINETEYCQFCGGYDANMANHVKDCPKREHATMTQETCRCAVAMCSVHSAAYEMLNTLHHVQVVLERIHDPRLSDAVKIADQLYVLKEVTELIAKAEGR